jgi:predicted nucleic acid-binding protein
MRGYLLDTNIPSETLRPRPDANVAAWLKSQVKDSQFLSVVTMGELRKGATLACHKRNPHGAMPSARARSRNGSKGAGVQKARCAPA